MSTRSRIIVVGGDLQRCRACAMNSDGTVAFYKNVIIGKSYGHKSPMFARRRRACTPW